MADRDLAHTGHRPQKVGQVVAVQVVAGVDAQAERQRRLGRGREAGQHAGQQRTAMGFGVGLGVELDAVGAAGPHGRHRRRVGIHEQADAHAQGMAFIDQGPQPRAIGGQIPAVVGGELALAVGHEGGLLRAHRTHQVHQVVEGVAFEVVLGLRPDFQQRRQLEHIAVADVPLIRPRMHRDAVGTGLQRQRRQPHDVRDAEVAGVAQQRDLVHVDRERGRRAGTFTRVIRGNQWVHRRLGFRSRSFCTSTITWRVRKGAAPR